MRVRARLPILLVALLLFTTWAGTAQDAVERACAPFSKLVVPEADKPTLQDAASAGTPCDPFDLYYRSSSPQRFAKARWCALTVLGMFRDGVDAAHIKAAQSAATGGATDPDLGEVEGLTLMMMYANGEGVARNPKVAQTLACQYAFQSPQGEIEQMPELVALLGKGEGFDLCGKDQGPQGRSVWYACTGMQAEKTAKAANKVEAEIVHAATPLQRAPFAALEKAWAELSSAGSESFGAVCDGGTGCGVYGEEYDLGMEKDWLAKLQLIHAGALPPALPEAKDLPRLDAELNAAYKDEIENAKIVDTSHTEVGLQPNDAVGKARTTERAWIRFRDAWVRYAATRWPDVPGDRWRAWLTAEWTKTMQAN